MKIFLGLSIIEEDNLRSKKISEIRDIAQALKITYYRNCKKAVLIKLISERKHGDIKRQELLDTLKRLGEYNESYKYLGVKALIKTLEMANRLKEVSGKEPLGKLIIDPKFKETLETQLIENSKVPQKFKVSKSNKCCEEIGYKWVYTKALFSNQSGKIIDNIKPYITNKIKINIAMHSRVFRDGAYISYIKNKTSGRITKWTELTEFIEKFETSRLDLESEMYSDVYRPAEGFSAEFNNQGGIKFDKIVIRLFPMKGPIVGCAGRDIQDWIINSNKVYSLHNKKENLCFWRCVALHRRFLEKGKTLYPRIEQDLTREAIECAPEYYENHFLGAQQKIDIGTTNLSEIIKV